MQNAENTIHNAENTIPASMGSPSLWKRAVVKVLCGGVRPALDISWHFTTWLVQMGLWIIMPFVALQFADLLVPHLSGGHAEMAAVVTYVIALAAGLKAAYTASTNLGKLARSWR